MKTNETGYLQHMLQSMGHQDPGHRADQVRFLWFEQKPQHTGINMDDAAKRTMLEAVDRIEEQQENEMLIARIFLVLIIGVVVLAGVVTAVLIL